MKTSCFVQTLGVLALLGLSSQSLAQTTAASDPVGFVTVNVPANSDAVLAVPLSRASVFKGVIQSISGNTITVAGTSPAWTTNQFVQALPGQVNTYAVQIASGTKEGMTGKVTANAANSVTIQLDPAEDLSGVQTEAVNGAGNGDHIDILPYWTPASLITSAVSNGSQILLLEATTAGINLSSSGSFGFDSGAWVDENTFEAADHAPLAFGRAFIFRNGGASVGISMAGSVPMTKHRIIIRSFGAGDQDVAVGFSSPVPTRIGSVGLSFTEDDQLLVFDNTASGQNKSASQVLYYTTGDGWVDETFSPVGTSFMLQPGQGYIFRKKGTGAAGTFVWTALQSYLAP
ncbi:MAG: TIGR02597 family protein [Verrucomicrobiaceae bacterium]|nr:TIGR02597 family protein [Verrucomicrobiaceae bacterium]